MKHETKLPLFGFFCTGTRKTYCTISSLYTRLCQNVKFHVKKEYLSLRPKICYFGTVRLELEKIIVMFETSIMELI